MSRAITTVSEGVFLDVTRLAIQDGVTVEEKLDALLQRGIKEAGTPRPKSNPKAGCLVPACTSAATSRGVCRRHYMMMRYYMQLRLLDEGWLVRHGRLLPSARTVLASAVPDDLSTLPRMPTRELRGLDVRWIFDWPASQQERKRLEG